GAWAMTASADHHFPGTGIPLRALLTLTAGLLALDAAGAIPDTPLITAAVSLLLLVAGMPHGGFDLALIRAAGGGTDVGSRAGVILLYLGCAAATYALWQVAPVLALAGFLALAVAHFAEDWRRCGSGLLAGGLAAAIVCAPAVLHADALRGLFARLAGDARAAVLADALLLAAPTAMVLAAVAIVLLIQNQHRRLAMAAACSLAAMLLLPPVIGFAVHFCLVHSPLQFRDHARQLGLRHFRQWRAAVIPLSLGGLAVAGGILVRGDGTALAHNLYASSFMALAVLVVPHMLVPLAMAHLKARRTRDLQAVLSPVSLR
ncbi:Brp/Blh family beta-carotene 15,15'-dioxygenase, partial [Sandarakinorhabdus sp.]|uniref:Brp/Blh family beta-carotene 15,15'-dioxygenase n=1 Tax=Sandarakinorhabdus sp. TaxID=1916663 RepID=UPI00356AEAC8